MLHPATCWAQQVPDQLDPVGGKATSDKAISLQATYTADLNADVIGGDRRGTAFLGKISAIADADLDRLIGLRSVVAHASVIDIFGTGLSGSRVGNLAAVSGIEAEPALRLNQVWVQADLGKLARLRVGKFPAAQDFAVSDTAAFFINATFGWPVSFASDLPQGGPSWPLAAPGLMIASTSSKRWKLSGAIFAGKPAGVDSVDPQRADRHGFGAFRFAGRPFVIIQATRTIGDAGAVKVGGWLHFNRFDAVDGLSREMSTNWSIYGVVDWRIAGSAESSRQVSVFLRATLAPQDRNPVSLYFDAGIVLASPFKSRAGDSLGLAYANARLSGRLPAPRAESGEKVVEISYSAALPRKVKVQPNLQLIFDPTDPRNFVRHAGTATVVGLRISGSL